MPRTADKKVKGKVWLPPDPASYDIKINSESVKTKIWGAEFTKAISPEVSSFKIILDNNNEEFTDYFEDEEVVQLYLDRVDGTTKKFEGTIDTLKNSYDSGKGFTIEVSGYQVMGVLTGITVTETYSGTKTCDAILKEMIDEYLTGYTYTNVLPSAVYPTLNWNNKPFWDCVEDLCKLAKSGGRFDCYVDDNKDFHFFAENSIECTDEAIVWNTTLISTDGLGTQTLTKKSKVIVYGDDGEGLPVISTTGTGTKEQVVFDSKITDSISAEDLSSSEYSLQNRTNLEGGVKAFILAAINPGETIYIADPVNNIYSNHKIYKYTHKFYDETTDVSIEKSRALSNVIKKRIENELALQSITNLNKMLYSLNLKFDSLDELESFDPNLGIVEGKVYLTSGAEANFTASKTTTSPVTYAELRVVGTNNTDTVYKVSTDGGDSYTTVTPNEVTPVPSGVNIKLSVTMNNASTELDSIALLLK